MDRKKGQSILEYIIVLTAVVAAVLVGVLTFAKKDDSTKGLGKLMDKAGGTIEKAGGKISDLNTDKTE